MMNDDDESKQLRSQINWNKICNQNIIVKIKLNIDKSKTTKK